MLALGGAERKAQWIVVKSKRRLLVCFLVTKYAGLVWQLIIGGGCYIYVQCFGIFRICT